MHLLWTFSNISANSIISVCTYKMILSQILCLEDSFRVLVVSMHDFSIFIFSFSFHTFSFSSLMVTEKIFLPSTQLAFELFNQLFDYEMVVIIRNMKHHRNFFFGVLYIRLQIVCADSTRR